MNGFRDAGVVIGLAIVLVGGVLAGAAGPIARLGPSYSDRDYALDGLALEYVGDYVDDPAVAQRIKAPYWCWTRVLEQVGKSPAVQRSEQSLRARARGMAERGVARFAVRPTYEHCAMKP